MNEQEGLSIVSQEKMATRANRQAEAMEPEQQKDGLNMGVELFEGRIKVFIEETSKQKAIPQSELCLLVSPYRKEDKYKVRFDIMRLKSNGTQPAIYDEHVLQAKVHQILGMPEVFVYVIKRKLQEAILESLKVLAEAENLPYNDLAFHISHDMKLSLYNKKSFHKNLDIQQIIQKI